MIYIMIFFFKIIEEALRTLRIIIIANGKKVLGAILQFFVTLTWLLVTGYVIIDIKDDPLKILFYTTGSLIGSYIGSVIEEKIALGTNVLMVEVNNNVANKIIKKLYKYKINKLKSYKENYALLMILLPRKKTNDVIKIIRLYDKKVNIISESATSIYPNHKYI